MEYLLIFTSLIFTSSGQLLQKLAADKANRLDPTSPFVIRILKQPETIWAVVCLAVGMALWLSVLYHMEVSKAVPFLSLGYVLVLLVSHYYLHESIQPVRWLGVLFIVLGTTIISIT